MSLYPMDDNGNVFTASSDANRHFSYLRYNADLTNEGLATVGLHHIDSKKVTVIDSVKHIKSLREVGRVVGKIQVDVAKHFRDFLGSG